MSRLHSIELHLLMLAGIAFLCVSGWQVWRVSNRITASLGQLDSTDAKLNVELDEAHRLTLEAGLTAMEARKASALELKYLPQWNKGIAATLLNANHTIKEVQGTARAATETLHGASLDLAAMNDFIQATKPLIDNVTIATGHIAVLASDPDFKITAANVQNMTADGARITKDAADEADKLAHPSKKKLGFWGGVWAGMQYVHKMMPSIF